MSDKIVVEIRGGTLVGIYANAPDIEARVVDWDDIEGGDELPASPFPIDRLTEMSAETREIVEGL